MSSVVDYEKCPRCGGILVVDFNCNTFEESKVCNRCGKREGWNYVRDDDYKVILDENGNPKKEIEDVAGFGVAAFQFEGVRVTYSLLENTEDAKAVFFDELEKNDKLIKEGCYLTVWDDELQDVKCEYGTMPETFEEFEAMEKELVESEDIDPEQISLF